MSCIFAEFLRFCPQSFLKSLPFEPSQFLKGFLISDRKILAVGQNWDIRTTNLGFRNEIIEVIKRELIVLLNLDHAPRPVVVTYYYIINCAPQAITFLFSKAFLGNFEGCKFLRLAHFSPRVS